jgi:hypothetical protein
VAGAGRSVRISGQFRPIPAARPSPTTGLPYMEDSFGELWRLKIDPRAV